MRHVQAISLLLVTMRIEDFLLPALCFVAVVSSVSCSGRGILSPTHAVVGGEEQN